ncbi:MAG: protein kinase domain-containing protein [Planctomycetota bacterium]|jgi:serine/threonine protein kinase/Flp pilus assembly protein TadD
MAAQMNDNRIVTLKEALQQFVEKYLQGRQPDIDEFVRQYPQHEAQLKKRIQDLREIDTLFDSIFRAEEREFEDEVAGHDLVGRKIGSFEIVEIIGRGGMGVVCLARDTKLKRSVAIKSLPTTLASDLTARTRFRREAELLASLNHPNIAVIHDIIEQDESAGYLVLEYVPGDTLAQRIAREPLKLEEALLISQQIAKAISAAHTKGIVHRDLKPGNIKITPDGQVKVLDFGLAKVLVSEIKKSETSPAQPSRIIGTPAYMSPEQARGQSTDHRTDIWSFGCILYQMLTSHLPFEGQTATDTLKHIIERQPDWDLLPKQTPENIRMLLRHCLEKDLNKRLGDITDAEAEIRETLNKLTIAHTVIKPTTSRKIVMTIGIIIISIVLLGVALKFVPEKKIHPSTKQMRLVVLPFENLGPAEDEYFVDGLTDEITSRLAAIHDLGVISRQSAMQYKNTEKNTPKITKELSVDYILEGTIQRERPSDPNSRVRIRSQLIKASDDTHVWAQNYDNHMSKIFELQSEVAEQVAQGLNIILLKHEQQALASITTNNSLAYEYYLHGNQYFHRSDKENDYRIAIQMFQKAVELDPNLALAYAQLSKTHDSMYWFYDRSEKRLEMVKSAVDKALKLEPELPEAHLALGYYYYHGHLDYERALKEFALAWKSQPNNSELLKFMGAILRRQGKFTEALINIKKALELDPLSSVLAQEVGTTLRILRRYPETETYYERAVFLAPDRPRAYFFEAGLYLEWEGNTKKARVVLNKALENARASEDPLVVNSLVLVEIYEMNYQGALDWISLIPENVEDMAIFIPNSLRYAQIYDHMDKKELAKKYFNDAKDILESKIQERPMDHRFHSSLGIAYAGLGRTEDAIREGKRSIELLPITKDAVDGTVPIEDLARIYVMVGKYEEAIEKLDFLLSCPGGISVPLLQLDPAWDPLREHADFIKLIQSKTKK